MSTGELWEVVRALRSLATAHDSNAWITPREARVHKVQLLQAMRAGAHEYDHAFTYDRSQLDSYLLALERIAAIVEQAHDEQPAITLLSEYLGSLRDRARALSLTDEAFTRVERAQSGLPEQALVHKATEVLTGSAAASEASPLTLTSLDLARRMSAALQAYDLVDWTVEVHGDMVARASVNGPLRRVRVRAETTFSEEQVDQLVVHEVGGHALRWANSQSQVNPLAQVALGQALPAEEGLALHFEQSLGLLSVATLRTYACRVLAVAQAASSGILDTARMLAQHLALEDAVELALRVKRGLKDPNAPGGMTKDWSYLGGMIQVGEIADSSPGDVQSLMAVKWSLQLLPTIRSLLESGELQPPRLYPDAVRLGVESRIGA